jgi:hypothetical protein
MKARSATHRPTPCPPTRVKRSHALLTPSTGHLGERPLCLFGIDIFLSWEWELQ